VNESALPPSYLKDDGVAMKSKNERVELEMQAMKYRQWSRQITDEQFLRRTKEKIEELERKLREIDE
jgi:hypothetical protein